MMKTAPMATVLLLLISTAGLSPAYALTARGVLERDKDYVHFELVLTVDFADVSFWIVKEELPEIKGLLREFSEVKEKIATLRETLSDLRSRLEDLTKEHPEVREIIEELTELDEELSKIAEKERPEIKEVIEELQEFWHELHDILEKKPEIELIFQDELRNLRYEFSEVKRKLREVGYRRFEDIKGVIPERMRWRMEKEVEEFREKMMKEMEKMPEEMRKMMEERMEEAVERMRRMMNVTIKESIREIGKRMKEKAEDLWMKHMKAPILTACWETPALQKGLKTCLGEVLNKTLQRLYGTTDVYITNFELTIELTKKTTFVDDIPVSSGSFKLTQSFDLHGVITRNESGVFIRSQFRAVSVTEEIGGEDILKKAKEVGKEARAVIAGWKFSPAKAMFLDLSVFSVPLQYWNRTYDSATDTTTFTLVRDVVISTPFGNVTVDPEVSLTIPGDAQARGDVITAPPVKIAPPILPVDLIPLLAVAGVAVFLTIAISAYWVRRRVALSALPPLRT